MAWNPSQIRVQAGSSAGGQFAPVAASTSSSSKAPKQKPKPKAAPKKTMKAKPAKARKVRSSKTKRRTVTVKRGDTLSGIARRSGESLKQLKKDNPGLFSKAHRGGNLIFPGNKVKLAGAKPKRSRVKAGVAAKPATKLRSSTTRRKTSTMKKK